MPYICIYMTYLTKPVSVKYSQAVTFGKEKCTKSRMLISIAVLASDDSSDDEPLIKKTTSAKKLEKKDTSPRSNGTNKKNAGLYVTNHILSVLC